jgi:hypothetical protein
MANVPPTIQMLDHSVLCTASPYRLAGWKQVASAGTVSPFRKNHDCGRRIVMTSVVGQGSSVVGSFGYSSRKHLIK